MQSQVELQLGHYTADLKNDREDEQQQDFQSLRLASNTKIKQKRENIFSNYDVQTMRARQNYLSDIQNEREKQEIHNRMELEQIKLEGNSAI